MATAKNKSDRDAWGEQAGSYSKNAMNITGMHAVDMIALLGNELLMKVKTILEVGCGTGAFGRAYVERFPLGIPGQTIILSDLSEGMLKKAEEAIVLPENYETRFKFQVEDGTKLDGIKDDSVDLVVSMFGVFLIPNQEEAIKSVRRVLKKPNGIFATASWMLRKLHDPLKSEGLGVCLQDAFETPIKAIQPPGAQKEEPWKNWSDVEGIEKMLCEENGFSKPKIYRTIHSSVWDFDSLWNMMLQNPVADIKSASPEDIAKAKAALVEFVKTDEGVEGPVLLWAVSNLAIVNGLL